MVSEAREDLARHAARNYREADYEEGEGEEEGSDEV